MTIASFERLKMVPDESKFVVHGFIRNVEELLSQDKGNNIVPDLVINLCILFYAMADRFDPKCIGPLMKLDEKTQCITQTNCNSNSAFLTNIFESGLHHWRFKINKCYKNSFWSQTLGIWKIKSNDNEFLPLNHYFTAHPDRTYGFANNCGRLISRQTGLSYEGDDVRDYGIKTNAGDIIDMYCDMNALELRFTINGKDYGKAFDIEPGKYRAVINLYDEDDSISLLQ